MTLSLRHLFCVLLFLVSARVYAENAKPVVKVVLRLPEATTAEVAQEIRNLISTKEGDPYRQKDVRRSIERLIESNKVLDVSVEATEVEKGMAVTFDVQLRQRVWSVVFLGREHVSDKDLRECAGKDALTNLFADEVPALKQRLEACYRDEGYPNAKVETSTLIAKVPGAEVLHIEENEPIRLKGFHYEGNISLPETLLHQYESVKKGQPISKRALESTKQRLEQLYRDKHYYRAHLDNMRVTDDGVVHLAIQSGPEFEFVFAGARRFPPKGLLGVLKYSGLELLDEGLIFDWAKKLEDFYVTRGFVDAHVTAKEERRGFEKAIVRFAIDEGEPQLISEINFSGNKKISTSELKRLLEQSLEDSAFNNGYEIRTLLDDPTSQAGKRGAWAYAEIPHPSPSQVFVEAHWLSAMETLTAVYHERGYLFAKVEIAEIEFRQRQLHVRIAVTEGPLTHVRKSVATDSPEFLKSYFREFEGHVFSEKWVDETRKDLTQKLADNGYFYSKVDSHYEVERGKDVVDVSWKIEPGPQVRIGKIFTSGLQRTKPWLLKGQITLKEGDVLRPQDVDDTRSRLLELNVFRSVDVKPLSPDVAEPVKDIRIEVKELNTFVLDVSAGWSYVEGPRVTIEPSFPNVGGTGISISGRFRGNYFRLSGLALTSQVDISDIVTDPNLGIVIFGPIGGRASISIIGKGLLPFDLTPRLDITFDRVFRQAFRFNRVAFEPGLAWLHRFKPVAFAVPELSLNLQNELEYTYVTASATRVDDSRLTTSDRQLLRFPYGVFWTNTVRFTPAFEFRDSKVIPHKGFVLQLDAALTTDISSRDEFSNPVDTKFITLGAKATGYIPIGSQVVLALALQGGRIFHLTPTSISLPVKRYYLGGMNSMRGFREESLVPEDQREVYRRQYNACRGSVIPATSGCSQTSQLLAQGKEVPSVGGELYVLGRAELRFPTVVIKSLDGGIFYEAGNLWLGMPNTFSLRHVVGVGVRGMTPAGAIVLDLGVNLMRVIDQINLLPPDYTLNEPMFNVNIGIGFF